MKRQFVGALLIAAFSLTALPANATVVGGGYDDFYQPQVPDSEEERQEMIEEIIYFIKILQIQIAALIAQETVVINRDLSQGDSGEDVRRLQGLLATSDDLYPEGRVTGSFDTNTKRAVERLQKALGYDETGRVDGRTLEIINQGLIQDSVPEHGYSFDDLFLARQRSQDARRISDTKQLQLANELYFDSNAEYAVTLDQLVSDGFIALVPVDPTDGTTYPYTRLETTDYHIGANLGEADNPALDGDVDFISSVVDGDDSDGCSGQSGRYCYDVRP